MTTADLLEREHTLLTAVTRYDELRTRDALAGTASTPALAREEALEMLALGELIARKAGYGRQLGIRTARAAGASWSQIGSALGTSKQSAWEAHTRWIDSQAEQFGRDGYQGMDGDQADAARALAGPSYER